MRSLTELQRLDFPDLLPPIEPVWLGDKGPSGHSSHGCSVSAQAIMGTGSVGGRVNFMAAVTICSDFGAPQNKV